ncbi:hypothetical protein C2W62_06805 [Candidatus Entotheonella serta]|nr:hypothetical protein C2W62_06805 [Candidatus Entotheonella serta]
MHVAAAITRQRAEHKPPTNPMLPLSSYSLKAEALLPGFLASMILHPQRLPEQDYHQSPPRSCFSFHPNASHVNGALRPSVADKHGFIILPVCGSLEAAAAVTAALGRHVSTCNGMPETRRGGVVEDERDVAAKPGAPTGCLALHSRSAKRASSSAVNSVRGCQHEPVDKSQNCRDAVSFQSHLCVLLSTYTRVTTAGCRRGAAKGENHKGEPVLHLCSGCIAQVQRKSDETIE